MQNGRVASSPNPNYTLRCSFPLTCKFWWQKRHWTNVKHCWLRRMKNRKHQSSHTNASHCFLKPGEFPAQRQLQGTFSARMDKRTWGSYPVWAAQSWAGECPGQIGGLQNLWREPVPLLSWLFSVLHLLLFLMCATHPEECTDSWVDMIQSAALLIWQMAGWTLRMRLHSGQPQKHGE